MSLDGTKRSGGLKGFLRETGALIYAGGRLVRERGYGALKLGYAYGGQVAYSLATLSMVVLMPLLFEIAREGQMLEVERSQVKDLKSRGYSDRQLQEMGFCENAIHSPSVASLKA